jgi:hypothetical protein
MLRKNMLPAVKYDSSGVHYFTDRGKRTLEKAWRLDLLPM